jgi:hypothetical protein
VRRAPFSVLARGARARGVVRVGLNVMGLPLSRLCLPDCTACVAIGGAEIGTGLPPLFTAKTGPDRLPRQ